jgi:hypothetical protein
MELALDEKYIPASKIEVSWAMVDSIPHPVPNRFLMGSYSIFAPIFMAASIFS